MKPREKIVVVFVTVPTLKVAREIARAVLEARLVACVNIVPRLESHYWWQGKIESAPEILMLIKTTNSKLAPLERLILSKHPYQTPEFIGLQICAANKSYAHWLLECVAEPGKPTRAK